MCKIASSYEANGHALYIIKKQNKILPIVFHSSDVGLHGKSNLRRVFRNSKPENHFTTTYQMRYQKHSTEYI